MGWSSEAGCVCPISLCIAWPLWRHVRSPLGLLPCTVLPVADTLHHSHWLLSDSCRTDATCECEPANVKWCRVGDALMLTACSKNYIVIVNHRTPGTLSYDATRYHRRASLAHPPGCPTCNRACSYSSPSRATICTCWHLRPLCWCHGWVQPSQDRSNVHSRMLWYTCNFRWQHAVQPHLQYVANPNSFAEIYFSKIMCKRTCAVTPRV